MRKNKVLGRSLRLEIYRQSGALCCPVRNVFGKEVRAVES